MQKIIVKPRVLIPVLILAAALVLVLLFTLRGNADEPKGEFADYAWQSVSGDSPESESTALRFLFTIGNLNYTRVGFVLSKTNANPTEGGDGCHVSAATKVYSSVSADGTQYTAAGRYWVALKVTGIPNTDFDQPIYARPFVDNGSEVRYGTTHALSVEGAFAIPALQTQIAAFQDSDFGDGNVTADLGNGDAFNALAANPTKGEHPRVLFTSESIDGLNAALASAPSAATDGYAAALTSPPTGELPSGEFDQETLNKIQMLALDYRMKGNPYSGYLAIRALKNVLKTMGDWTVLNDYTRNYGFLMYNAACVYDWCYELLQPADREQIVLGVEKKCCGHMEVGFPPTGQHAVVGHGTEFQILRDYLSFAIAIYDEYPGWWNMIANRFYTEFVPVRNEFYEAGMYPQGVSLYVRLRYSADLYSAWLVEAATGSFPYASETNMMQVARTIYSYDLPRTNGFAEGDDQASYRDFIDYGRVALLSSYLFDDATMRAQVENKKGIGYGSFSDGFSEGVSVAEYLICSSSGLEKANSIYADMDLILYNGGWLGQIIARDKWTSSQAAVLMKIGCRTAGNHDHYDAGSFQIFYKSPLAIDSGCYFSYGNDHHYYYHQATIAHNSLLIYNPSLSSTDEGYYSGGQKRRGEPDDLSAWQGNTYKTGEVTGVSYGYNESTPTYAYIAGDIAAAYDSSVASEVTRRMLAVYATEDSAAPMYFFVFDNITAKDASFKKTFLLHVPKTNAPTIEGKTVSVVNYNGKLVLQNVVGGDVITTKGQYEMYSGTTLAPGDRDDGAWGRVEISPNTGSATNQMLNVMYVCDAENDPELVATAVTGSEITGAAIGNTVAVFVTSATRRTTEFSFTASGSGTKNYYVSGVVAGDWTVYVGGEPINVATATEEGGFLTFSAPAGSEITLRPGAPNMSVENGLPENNWDNFDFSNIVP